VHLPDQDLAGFDRIEATRSGNRKTGRVPRSEQAFRLEVQLAAGEVNVNEGRIRHGDALTRFESRDMERRIAVADPDRRLVLMPRHPGRHHRQPALQVGWVELQLLVSGHDLGLIRHDPHLNQVQRLAGVWVHGRPVVLLRVPDTGSGGHALGQVGIDDAVVALRVLMNQRAVQHPRHDLHVAVRMGFEPGPGRDGVVVVDHEHAVVRVTSQRVDSRVERMASVQPPDPGLMAIRAAAKAHVWA
jgi:hypothetical protein